MQILSRRTVPAAIACLSGFLALSGCGGPEKQVFTRIHLANGSDSELVYLAIADSEMAVSVASNRLSHPLPPHTVYSAVLSRPGNYWVRTELESEGSTIRRIEGPIRLGRGIHQWEFTGEDEKPLYDGSTAALAVVAVGTP